MDPQVGSHCGSCSSLELSPFCATVENTANWVIQKQGSLFGAIVVAAGISAIRSGGRRIGSLRLHREG